MITIEKAIEILTIFNKEHHARTLGDLEKAQKLGIEALKKVQYDRLPGSRPLYDKLPGEDK